MKTTTTAKATIRIAGEETTYGILKLHPQITTSAGSIDLASFHVKLPDGRIEFSDMTVMRALPNSAQEDILYSTYEADEEDRIDELVITYEIPQYDERIEIRYRAVEYDDELIGYEVEDQAGDWIPVEDALFEEFLTPSFSAVLEMSILDQLHDHNVEYLLMDDES